MCIDVITGLQRLSATASTRRFAKNLLKICQKMSSLVQNYKGAYFSFLSMRKSYSKSWLSHWERVIPFFAFPDDIRKVIYTTNAIESLNMKIRKVLRNHRSFPTDESAMKVIFMSMNNISKKWTMPLTQSFGALIVIGKAH